MKEVYNCKEFVQSKLEATAEQFPNKPALLHVDKSLSFADLDMASNAIANQLISNQLKTEDFVAVYLERSMEMMISIFGILKAGGCYLPLDINSPMERVKAIVEDAMPSMILTSKEFQHKFTEHDNVIVVDGIHHSFTDLDTSKPSVLIESTNLAYCIYTSGTTGIPKGVLIEHHSLMNRIDWMQKEYPIQENDILLQKTPVSFDVSIWELFWWSFVGATLVLLPKNHEKDPGKLASCIQKNKVSVLHFVPSMFSSFINYLESISPLNKTSSVKWLFCSGEALPQQSVVDFYRIDAENGNTTTVINLYGPTEATVDVTYYTCQKDIPNPIPIGKAIDNTRIVILNEQNETLPEGEMGELAITGVNLSRGYLNRPELNAEKFVQVYVDGKPNRAYKTGDLAFFNSEGNIIYKGRNDNQIKLRGFRIELGDIENSALSYSDMAECACILDKRNIDNPQIACFFVSKSGDTISDQSLRVFLKDLLPEYMIPSGFYQIDAMPLSANGKLNRKALFSMFPQQEDLSAEQESESISGILKSVWSKLLNRNDLPEETNFFDLGGNSLMLVQCSIILKSEHNIDIDVITLLQYPTISKLSESLKK